MSEVAAVTADETRPPRKTNVLGHLEGPEIYVVWLRSDGYVGYSAGYLPKGDAIWKFTLLLETCDWPAAHARIRAEHVAIVMNEDLWPIAETAQGNRAGVA